MNNSEIDFSSMTISEIFNFKKKLEESYSKLCEDRAYDLKSIDHEDFDPYSKKGEKSINAIIKKYAEYDDGYNFLMEEIIRNLELRNVSVEEFKQNHNRELTNEQYIEKASQLAPCKVIGWANKPNPKVMGEYLNSVSIKPENAVMVGDRPLTDILAGKLLGCKTILVGSINPSENLPTRLVRALERSTIRK